MVNPSESFETVRCGMCGKLNPVENAVCAFCGARLRPMTPEEMGLTPSSPSTPQQPPASEGLPATEPLSGGQPLSDPDDPLASLRREFMDQDDETIVGPSASQDRIRRQSLYEDVEPDFTIGQAPASEDEDADAVLPGDIPDWLREASKPPTDTGSLPPLGDVPDWLIEETRPSPAPSPLSADEVEIPDWLGKPGAEGDDAVAPEAPSVPSWLDETASAEATRPMPEAESTPDWLRDLDSPEGGEEEEKPLFEIPDWLSEETKPAEPITPEPPQPEIDWLRPPQDVELPSEPESAEAGEQAEPSTGVPDWLREAAGESTPPDEVPQPSEPVMEIDVPDWPMPESELQPPADSGAEPAGTPEPEEPEALEIASAAPAPLVDSGMPDWLMNLAAGPIDEPAATSEPPAAADEIPGRPDIEDEGEVEPAALDVAALDWLRPPGETPDVADWLRPPDKDVPSEAETDEAPDWMREPEAAEAPASMEEAVSETPASEVEVPEWMAEPGGASGDEMGQWDEAPAPASEETPAEPAFEVPEWLSGLAGEPSAAPPPAEAEAPSTPEPEVPEWLAGLGAEPAPVAAPHAEEAASEVEPDVPEWLAELGGEPSAPSVTQVEEVAPAEDLEVPDWLAGLGAEPAGPAVSKSDEVAHEGEPEVPDWLAGLEGEPASPAAPEAEEAAPAGELEVPDWLTGLSGEPTAHAAPEGELEVPDWLAGLESEPASPAAPESESETPDWLAGHGAEPAEQPAFSAEPEMPDWLAGAPTPPAELEQAAEPALSDETPDWLADLDDVFNAPVGAAPLESAATDDLLDLSLPPLPAQEEAEVDLAEAANLPEWLRTAAPDAPAGLRPLEGAGDLPPELAGLRFEAITGQRGDQPVTEKIGALKDVTGVLRPEILFPGETLRVGELVDQLIITDEQKRRVNALHGLFAREAQGVVVAEQQSTMPVLRWVVALILLGGVILGLLIASQGLSPLSAPQPNAGVSNIHSQIEALPAGSTVVMAFEYEPETAAEMQALAVALVEQLASRNATIYTLSTHPTGPAMAETAMAASATGPPAQWVNLGYISGGSRGISALAIGSLPGMISPLSYDYHGEATNLGAARLADLDPAMIVILTSRWEDLRGWVEQVGPTTDAPMLAAMSAGAAPMAYPYAQSGQLTGVLSGVNDAAAYRGLNAGSPADPLLSALWNGQAFGGLIAALMILGGGLMYGLAALRQEEQE